MFVTSLLAITKELNEMVKKHPVLLFVLILFVSALACNFPTRDNISAPTPEGPEATFTALAQTLEVILTQTAVTTLETPTPTTTQFPTTCTHQYSNCHLPTSANPNISAPHPGAM
jgi:hypothetical protein